MFRIKTVVIVAVALFILVLFSTAASAAARVEVVPDRTRVKEGEVLGVQVRIVPDGIKVFAAEIRLDYDPATLRAIHPQTRAAASNAVVGGFFAGTNKFVAENEVDPATGTVRFTATYLGRDRGQTAAETVFSISFMPVTSGATDITFGAATIVDAELADVAIDKYGCMVSIEPAGGPVPPPGGSIPIETPVPVPPVMEVPVPAVPVPGTRPVQPAAARAFSDLEGHWAAGVIQALTERGFIGGFPDGSFGPGSPITRAQFVAILVRIVNPAVTTHPAPYTDVKAEHWAAADIARATAAGFAGGSDGRFRPNDRITRLEMAGMLAAFIEQDGSAAQRFFTDAGSIPAWAAGDVWKVQQAGIVGGFPDGSFRPQSGATRADAAAMLMRFVNHKGL